MRRARTNRPTTLRRTIMAADLFCGAGGATSAVVEACRRLGHDLDLVAVNHWQTAVDTHKANYPGFVHYCQAVGKVSPRKAVPGGYLDILVAGPECTFFSRAAGKRPKNKQSRASAFDIVWWLEELDVRCVLIENVREFIDWGPLDEKNKPIEALKGYYFRLFCDTLRELDYRIEWRLLTAADFGDPTTRQRFFLVATKEEDGAFAWPTPSHRPASKLEHFPDAEPWVPVRDILDLSLPSVSIYDRPAHGLKELCSNTLNRIYAGVRKYSGVPFLVPNFGERQDQAPRTHSVDMPLPTVTSRGAGDLAQPIIVPQFSEAPARSADDPLGTITTTSRGVGMAQPFVVVMRNNCDALSMEVPCPTLCTNNHVYLAQPEFFMTTQRADAVDQERTYSLDRPLTTVTTQGGRLGVVKSVLAQPEFLITTEHAGGDQKRHEHNAHSLDRPMRTITGQEGALNLVNSFIVPSGGPTGAARNVLSMDQPMWILLAENHQGLAQPALQPSLYYGYGGKTALPLSATCPTGTAQWNHLGVIEPFVLSYHGGRDGDRRHQLTDEPIPTLDTSNRFALCQFVISYYGNGENVATIADPLATVTTRDRFALIELVFVRAEGEEQFFECRIAGWLDILYRMLTPEELAAAHSFPKNYIFTGSKDARVKQVGNSWPVKMGAALVESLLSRPLQRRTMMTFPDASRGSDPSVAERTAFLRKHKERVSMIRRALAKHDAPFASQTDLFDYAGVDITPVATMQKKGA